METHPRDIKGMRGSWFANAHGYEEYLPIMWSYEYDGKTQILETGWMNKEDIQTSKSLEAPRCCPKTRALCTGPSR